MSMTRKDFNLLASTLRAEGVSPGIAKALARELAAEYPRFSIDGFIAACTPDPNPGCHGCADPVNHPHTFDCERSPQRSAPEPTLAADNTQEHYWWAHPCTEPLARMSGRSKGATAAQLAYIAGDRANVPDMDVLATFMNENEED